MEELDTSGCLDELMKILADATGMSQYELENMGYQEVYNLAYVAANYKDDWLMQNCQDLNYYNTKFDPAVLILAVEFAQVYFL